MSESKATTSYTYDVYGKILSQTDAGGNKTKYAYDENDHLASETRPDGSTITYQYDENGNITQITYPDGTASVSAVYDAAGNTLELVDTLQSVSRGSYSAGSQLVSMTQPNGGVVSYTYYDNGLLESQTDAEGNTQTLAYDGAGRVVSVTDAAGNSTKYGYDEYGNLATVEDCLGNVTRMEYYSFRKVVKQTDAMGNTASMTYDSMGNVESITNPNGGVTTYQYDLNNNLTDETIGEDYHVSYTYNTQNLPATKTNSRGNKTAYEYDALGRITKQSDEAGTITYTYDENGNVLTVTDESGTITRTYDKLNRVKTYEDAMGNKIAYEYDSFGNVSRLIYPSGEAVIYTYDRNGNVKTVTDWKNRTTMYSYDKNGRLVKTERPDGTVETRTYDKVGRLISILDKKGETVVNDQEYSYDASGNITELKALESGELNFGTLSDVKMTYDTNNRLLTYNGETVRYDKDGNMVYGPLNGSMAEFTYDCRNRLVKAGDTVYEYDAENNRTAVVTGTKRTEYVVNSQPELSQVLRSTVTDTAEKDAKPEVTYYFYGKGLQSQENDTDGYLTYHFNNVGSTMAVTNQKGEVIKEYAYSPYGELLFGEHDESIQFLYNGQYGVTTDSNGLYYMRARYYNVDIKRFVNQDVLTGTLERISSLNRYSYVEGNPVSFLDPFGLEPYDTTDLHAGATVLSLVGFVLTLFPATASIGIIVSVGANGFDLGLTLYDVVGKIKNGNTEDLLLDISNIIVDLIGIITAGMSNGYFKTAQAMDSYGGIMGGYVDELGRLFSEWNYADGVVSKASFFNQIRLFLEYCCAPLSLTYN